MFNLFKKSNSVAKRELYNTYSEDLYAEVADAKPSKMVGLSFKDFDFSLDNVVNRLKADDYVSDVIIDEKQSSIVVFTNYSGVQEQVILYCYDTQPGLVDFIQSSNLIKNANFGVDNHLLTEVLTTKHYIYSNMIFQKDDPFASYQTQAYIMQVAIDLQVLFDESSRKILHSSFIPFILERDLKYYVKNLFTIVGLETGWTYTIGLGRFYLKDYEINNVKLTPGLYNVLEMEVLKQFEFGCVKSGATQAFSNDVFVTYVDIEDATKFLSTKLLGTSSFRGEEYMIDYQVLLYTKTLQFELEKIEKKLINSKFNPSGIQMIPTAVTENIHQAVINTEDYFKHSMIENGLYKILTIKFGLQTGEEIEYIWGRILSVDNSVYKIELLNQSIHDETAQIGSIVTATYDMIIDWIILEDIHFELHPYNLYILKNPRYIAFVNELKLNEI